MRARSLACTRLVLMLTALLMVATAATPGFSATDLAGGADRGVGASAALVATDGVSPAGAPAPRVIPRTEWDPAGTCPVSTGTRTAPHRITVHHTHAPVVESRGEVPRAMRLICKAHMGRGFDEIGYHYAIDPFGRIWQGRGPLPGEITQQVRNGAHAQGFNDNAIGVVFIGDFQQAKPTAGGHAGRCRPHGLPGRPVRHRPRGDRAGGVDRRAEDPLRVRDPRGAARDRRPPGHRGRDAVPGRAPVPRAALAAPVGRRHAWPLPAERRPHSRAASQSPTAHHASTARKVPSSSTPVSSPKRLSRWRTVFGCTNRSRGRRVDVAVELEVQPDGRGQLGREGLVGVQPGQARPAQQLAEVRRVPQGHDQRHVGHGHQAGPSGRPGRVVGPTGPRGCHVELLGRDRSGHAHGHVGGAAGRRRPARPPARRRGRRTGHWARCAGGPPVLRPPRRPVRRRGPPTGCWGAGRPRPRRARRPSHPRARGAAAAPGGHDVSACAPARSGDGPRSAGPAPARPSRRRARERRGAGAGPRRGSGRARGPGARCGAGPRGWPPARRGWPRPAGRGSPPGPR